MGDRVFREVADGLEFVGDFDGLYADEADPWGQSGTSAPMAGYYGAARAALADVLKGRKGVALEVGCGLGHALAYLAENTALEWHGMDISRRAVALASTLYPQHSFRVGDIRKPVHAGRFDVVLLNQVLWYVLPQLDAVVENCLGLLKPGATLVVAQAYLRGEQRFGREIAHGYWGAFDLFSAKYGQRLHCVEGRYNVKAPVHDDGILVFQA